MHRAQAASDQETRQLYHGQCAQLLATLRDFQRADEELELARLAGPDRRWHFVERAYVLEQADKYHDALAAARDGLAAYPRYVPAVRATAHCLRLVGRDDEALQLLRRKAAELESGDVVVDCVGMLVETEELGEVESLLSRHEDLTPIAESATQSWRDAQRLTLARHRDDYTEVLRLAESIDRPFFAAIAENLREVDLPPQTGRRRKRLLDVPFIRQHHLTCAPATLTALSRFWQKPAEHLAVAEEVCYDGTPWHSERRWAEEHGWRAREFRVDWESAVALIDRGIPFTLTLTSVTDAHLQAVIGYDEPTGVLFMRDPYVRTTMEASARGLFENQRSVGPRGLAIVPAEDAALLDGLALPEADLYDRYHALALALDVHDRDRAMAHCEALENVAPGHRLALTARRAIAAYDADAPATLEALEALLGLFPDDASLQLARLGVARELEDRESRVAWLESIVHRDDADAVLLLEYAVELSADDRDLDRTEWYLRRAARRRLDANVLARLAEVVWKAGDTEWAVTLFRFAACTGDRNEAHARNYFLAARSVGEAEVALAFLRHRFEMLGRMSGAPGESLVSALEILERVDEALSTLEEVSARHPEDGEILLLAATKHMQYGHMEAAERFLADARGKVKHTAWLHCAGQLARWGGDRLAALRCWREVVDVEPLDLQAHSMIAMLLSESQSREAARLHLRRVCGRFPHHAALHRLLYEWTEGDPAVEREETLRQLLAIDVADAWAHRELALNLRLQSRMEEARAVAEEAVALHARSPHGQVILGVILKDIGERAQAAACFRTAVRLSAEAPNAIRGLLETEDASLANRTAILEFFEAELRRQAVVGEGVLAYRDAARGILTREELRDALQRLHEHRPDLWQAWSALSHHVALMGRLDEALEIAQGATERFSKLPRVWLDLGYVHQLRREPEAQIDALSRCRELNPEWTEPIIALCDALERVSRVDEIHQTLEAAVARRPLDTDLRYRLAIAQYRRGEHERALEVLTGVLRIDPDHEPSWQGLAALSGEFGQGKSPLDLAREIAESREREAGPWARLAAMQIDAGELEEALTTIDRALAIAPRAVEAYDLKASALAKLQRYAEAKETCNPAVYGDLPPLVLRGRAAWVEAESGRLAGAIEQMVSVVTVNTDYEWGWRRLVEWYAARNQNVEALEAAERVAWLAPDDMVPQGWLAFMKRQSGDAEGARQVLRRAMELEPTYLFAGFEYFDLQLEDRDLSGAARTLEILAAHAPDEEILAARARLEAANDNQPEALRLVEQMLRAPSTDADSVQAAATAIFDRGWHDQLIFLCERLLRGSSWHPLLPALMVDLDARRGRFGGWRRYRDLKRLGLPGREAIHQLLEVMGADVWRRRSRTRHRVRLFIVRQLFRPWVASDDVLWGEVGYVLTCQRRYRATIKWLRGWQTREALKPWMVHNLAFALIMTGRYVWARSILRYIATQLAEREVPDPRSRFLCAFGACLDDDLTLAQRLVAEVPPDPAEDDVREFRTFAELVIRVLDAPGGKGSLSQEDAKQITAAARDSKLDPGARRLANLIRIKIGRHTRDPWMVLAGWRGLHSTLITVTAVATAIGLGYLVLR
jgi:tetratricopeptide (TPR) repeat protein